MEVAPHELAQLLKLAGVGVGPEPEVMSEPDMPGAEIEPEVSVMAIPSDDGAPVDGGCGAPEPEHEHDPGGDMRGIIDMLTGGEEPIEEAPPKDYENASNEFTGHPEEVASTYDDFSYEPARHSSGGQRRTNSYGDNPLREEDMIKEYTEYKTKIDERHGHGGPFPGKQEPIQGSPQEYRSDYMKDDPLYNSGKKFVKGPRSWVYRKTGDKLTKGPRGYKSRVHRYDTEEGPPAYDMSSSKSHTGKKGNLIDPASGQKFPLFKVPDKMANDPRPLELDQKRNYISYKK